MLSGARRVTPLATTLSAALLALALGWVRVEHDRSELVARLLQARRPTGAGLGPSPRGRWCRSLVTSQPPLDFPALGLHIGS